MSHEDWYAQRLAQLRGAPPPPGPVQAPQYPPTAPVQHVPGQLPAHLAPMAVQPQQYAAAAPLPGSVMPQGGHSPASPAEVISMIQNGQLHGTTYNAQGAQVADDGHVAMLAYAAGTTGGSKVVREHTGICPNCNRPTLFESQEGGVWSKLTGGKVNAQQCATCNWPKVQAGSQGGALATARGAGPAKQARQLPANHRVTVAVEGGGYATFEPPTGA